MIRDIRTILWKEWRENGVFSGGRRELGLLLFVALLGIYVPVEAGAEWLDSVMSLAVWAWLPMVLSGPQAVDSFAGERERHTLETLLAGPLSDRAILLGKLASAASYALAVTWTVMLVGLVAVNAAHGHGQLLFYPPMLLAGGIGISIMSALAASGFGTLISLASPSTRHAQQVLGRLPIVFLLLAAIASKVIPETWLLRVSAAVSGGDAGRIVFAGLCTLGLWAGVTFWLVRRRFKRTSVTVD